MFLATNDAFLVALDALTGAAVWESKRADYREFQVAQTNGPLVVNGKLLTGSRCNPQSTLAGGCFITANDIETGAEIWRINTAATPDQPGGDTWGGIPVSARHATSPWMVGSYDPDQNLVFWGTGPAWPLVEELEGIYGVDMLYTNSTLALDPDTGEFLWARPTIFQNVMTDIDVHTGRVSIADESMTPSCPHLFGGKNQPSGAYSPHTNAIYMPMNQTCRGERRMAHIPGADPATAQVGRFEAISVATGRTLWTHRQRAPFYGSALTTGGDLVFLGDLVRRFRAHDAETGDVLWETILNGPVGGRPMTYRVGGRQYLAIGSGGLSMDIYFLPLTPELSTPTGSNTIFVFFIP